MTSLDSLLASIENTIPDYASAYAGYLSGQCDADPDDAISAKQRALIRLAISITAPGATRMEKMEDVATSDEIKHAVCIAINLRAGAAIAYGRLAFKLLDDQQNAVALSEADQIRRDREYMTHFRKASPGDFDRLVKVLSVPQRQNLPLSKLTQELIAIACATVTQCVYCIEKHVKAANDHGASMKQIGQAIHIAITARMEATLLKAESFCKP